jgi:hypothetical protein
MRKKVKKRETKNICITTIKYKMKLIFIIAFIIASIMYI